MGTFPTTLLSTRGGFGLTRLLMKSHFVDRYKSARLPSGTGLLRQPISPEPPPAEGWCRWALQPGSLYPYNSADSGCRSETDETMQALSLFATLDVFRIEVIPKRSDKPLVP